MAMARPRANLKGAAAAIKNAQAVPDYGGYDPVYCDLISQARSKLLQEELKPSKSNDNNKVQVFVRKRPLNKQEQKAKNFDVLTCVPNQAGPARCVLHEPKKKVDLDKFVQNHQFQFDAAFGDDCDNDQLYNAAVQPLLTKMSECPGTSGTVFAYGQTGSGKTYTISSFYARLSTDIFQIAAALGATVSVRFFEVYGGKAFDLLSGGAHCLVQESAKGEVCIVGLTECDADSPEIVCALIDVGLASRKTGATSANAESSRSHSLFEVNLHRAGARVGKITMVDLAGSERGADRGNCDSRTRREGAEINKSLLALKECIRALYSGQVQHVPFRGSRLTHIMRDAFIGDKSHTIVVACLSPASNSSEHTLNTLRYASRIKEKSAHGGCGGDHALNGGVPAGWLKGVVRKPLEKIQPNYCNPVVDVLAHEPVVQPVVPTQQPASNHSVPAAPAPNKQLVVEAPKEEPKPHATPPTPMRPPVINALLNMQYKKKKKIRQPKHVLQKKPVWVGGDEAAAQNEEERGSWLYQQAPEKKDEKVRGFNTPDKPAHDPIGMTQEVQAIQLHDDIQEETRQHEQALVELHVNCCFEMCGLVEKDQNLLAWAKEAHQAGELDVQEYSTRLQKVLEARAALDKKLQAQLRTLHGKLALEDAAATKVEMLLNV